MTNNRKINPRFPFCLLYKPFRTSLKLLNSVFYIFVNLNGAEILLYSGQGEKLEIAKGIQRYFVKHGFTDRGIRIRKNLAVLRRTSMPSLLIEVGFITNDYDNALFDGKFNILADCIAKGFMEAVGMKFRSLKKINESK